MKIFFVFLLTTLFLASSARNLAEDISENSQGTAQTTSSQNNNPTIKEQIAALEKEVIRLSKENAELKQTLSTIPDQVKSQILEYIKNNGLQFGNRWKISEEGTGSYEALVFRDMKSTKAGFDRRIAMFKERYINIG